MQRQRKEFNDTDLSEIELYEDGKLLVLDPDVLKEWHYMGLSNMDYVMSDVYNTTKTMWEAVDDNPRNLVSKT